MDQKPSKKTLRIKLAFIIFFGILIPAVSVVIVKNPQAIILVGLISFALTLFFVFLVLKPLQTLLKGTQSLSDGNLNFRIDIRSNDEFEEVGSSFNLMAQKLAQNVQKLEQDQSINLSERDRLEAVLSSIIDGIIALDYSRNVVFVNKAAEYLTGYTKEELFGKPFEEFIHIFSDKEEIIPKVYCEEGFNQSLVLVGKDGKQKKVNLTTASTASSVQTNLGCILIFHDLSREQELEQMKFDFVSMASHELKTPLTNIIGYLSVFINENRNKIQREGIELLDRSLTSAKGLLTLVENILSVNKIEREKFTVEIVEADYLSLLTKVVQDCQNQAKLKNISLTLTTPQTPIPKALLDPIRITEVINNLLGNAINYTPSGGMINVSLEVTPTEIVTTVSDTGVGIPKEAIPHLFTKFFRVSNIEQKASKGTGLGLFIAKSIIEKLNGKIWVESEIGKGSKFHFSIPKVAETQANVSTDKVVSETIQSGALNY